MEREKGFTLIEVLISLAILGLGMVLLFNLFPMAWQSLVYSHKLNQVSLVSQKKLEELKSQSHQIQMGEISGKEGDLNWKIMTKPLELSAGIKLTYVELDIDFDFLGRPQKQRFITYLVGNQ